MATQVLHRQVRFLDIARAFSVLANHADKALDLAVEVSEDTIRVIESNLHNVAQRLNGDPIAEEIEMLLAHPFTPSPPIAIVGEKERTHGTFTWRTIENPNPVLGNKRGAFVCNWQGMKLEITKQGPANYEAKINGTPILHGKFKSNVRERLEKEALRRAA